MHCNQSDSTLQLQVDLFCLDVADAVDAWLQAVGAQAEIGDRMQGLIVIRDLRHGIAF